MNLPSSQNDKDAVLQTLVTGDLSRLSTEEKLNYYNRVCESLGLNPLTKPFSYIKLNGKETLYASRDCTDQLRKINQVSITITDRTLSNGVYIVTCKATLPSGRCDESTGVVSLENLKGDNLANALLKCETKSKRRVTLSICGLGWLDETEIETIKDAKPVESVRLPIKTMQDITHESAKELQSSLQEDKAVLEKSVPFKVPEKFKDVKPFDQSHVVKFGPDKGKSFDELGADNISKKVQSLKVSKAGFAQTKMAQDFITEAVEWLRKGADENLDKDFAGDTMPEPPQEWKDEPFPDWNKQ